MRMQVIAANWKMHGSKASIVALLQGIKAGVKGIDKLECIILPPYLYVSEVEQILAESSIAWGGQNLSANEEGPYTGEIAASMLVDFGCRYVLVGHSERRQLYGEDNTLIALKFAQAKRNGLIPILCVGETLTERQNSQTDEVISQQIDAILHLDGGIEALSGGIIAYEPVWAIGTGMAATPEQAQQVHETIRNKVSQLDQDIAKKIPILYGGSVKANNARSIFAMPDIDGGLIGSASLEPEEFLEIMKCIH